MKSIKQIFTETKVPKKLSDCHGVVETLKFTHVYAMDAYPMVIYFCIYCIWFVIIEHMTRLHYTVIHVPLDDMIPFIPQFIIPYYMWFFYVIITTFVLYFKDREMYHRCCTFMAIGMTIFLITSTLWPNIQYLRPAEVTGDNIFIRMCEKIWNSDTPTNICPSIHVFNSIAIMAAVRKSSWKMMKKLYVRIPMMLIGVSIILSTMFVKQHSVFDVTVAFLIAVPFYILCYRMGFTFAESDLGLLLRRRHRRKVSHI